MKKVVVFSVLSLTMLSSLIAEGDKPEKKLDEWRSNPVLTFVGATVLSLPFLLPYCAYLHAREFVKKQGASALETAGELVEGMYGNGSGEEE
jgi:hypothetical protein